MDVQLQELIEKIRTEGVEKAQQKAGELVEDAKKSADEIVSHAKQEAERIIAEAKSAAEKSVASGRDALEQSARDLLIGLKRSIETLFERVIETEVTGALSGEVLERAILKSLDSITVQDGAELELSEKDAGELGDRLRTALSKRLSSGLTITASPKLSAGFRISVENGSAYYDVTPREIAEVLSAFLGPRLSAILADASGE